MAEQDSRTETPMTSLLGLLPFNVQQQPLTICSTRTWQLHQSLTNGATHVQPLIEELPSLPINRHPKRESKVRENVSAIERKRERGAAVMGSSPTAIATVRDGS